LSLRHAQQPMSSRIFRSEERRTGTRDRHGLTVRELARAGRAGSGRALIQNRHFGLDRGFENALTRLGDKGTAHAVREVNGYLMSLGHDLIHKKNIFNINQANPGGT
jgi:hypothetical protein